MYATTSKELLHFLDRSPSSYHAIANLKTMLEQAQFSPLREETRWDIRPGGRYYVTRNQSSLIAFRVPMGPWGGFQIGAAHSDSPAFKVKTNCEMGVEGHYRKLNVEKYGGMLCAPWFDRPLSVAGRILVREGGKLVTKLVNVDRDLLMIPNLAIHMNRQVNEGFAYDPQVDLLPLFSGKNDGVTLRALVAQSAGVQEEDMVGDDLFLYPRMQGTIWGAENEFISSRALDDLQCAWSLMRGLIQAEENPSRVAVCAIFDNEEVGSGTKQGADSTFLSDVLERVNESLGGTRGDYQAAIANSFMVSADNAHAVHPNHPEKADPTNRPYLNEGIVIKYNANQKYTTDGVSEGIFRTICQRAGAPVQTYTNRSNIAGGSTLGNISNAHVSLNTVDIGLPQLGMHSPYETAGVKDTAHLVEAMKQFYHAVISAEGDGVYEVR